MPFLLGGVDVALECVGSRSSLDLALRTTKAGGRVVLTGIPAGADLTPVWFRELKLVGAYTSGEEQLNGVARSKLWFGRSRPTRVRLNRCTCYSCFSISSLPSQSGSDCSRSASLTA